MTKFSFIDISNISNLIYYCNNHRINRTNNRLTFKKEPCNRQIKFIGNVNKFYMVHSHNNICEHIPIYDNTVSIDIEINKFSTFKDYSIQFNTLINIQIVY